MEAFIIVGCEDKILFMMVFNLLTGFTCQLHDVMIMSFSVEGQTSQNSNESEVTIEPAVTVKQPEATNDETKTKSSKETALKTDGVEGVNEKPDETVDVTDGKDEGPSEERVKESSEEEVKECSEEKVKESSEEEEAKDPNGEGTKDTEGKKDEGI